MLHNVAQTLANPIYVMKSRTVPDSYVAIYPILSSAKERTPVMISLLPNYERNHIEVNLITSFYAKDTWKQYQDLIKYNLLYVDNLNKKEEAIHITDRLYVPAGGVASANSNVLYKSELVKEGLVQDTSTKKENKKDSILGQQRSLYYH